MSLAKVLCRCVFFTSILALTSRAWCLDSCEGAFQTVEPRLLQISSTSIRLKTAIPDYNPKNEMIFYFHKGVHSSLYVGGYFWDHLGIGETADIAIRKDPKSISRGIAVRVRIGEDAVRRIVTTLEIQGKKMDRAMTNSCHLNQLAFLQRHGVFLRGSMVITGTSTFRSVFRNGFVGENGVPMPTIEILFIEEPNQDRRHMLVDSLHTYPPVSIEHFAWAFHLSSLELAVRVWNKLRAVNQRSQDLPTFEIPNLAALNSGQNAWLNAFLEKLEIEVVAETQRRFGVSGRQILEIMAYQRYSVPVSELHSILDKCIDDVLSSDS